MAKLLKLRRGTTTQHASFTGAEGEVTIDTSKDTAVVHDGSTQGGTPLAKENMSNVSSASIAGRLGTDSIATSKIAAGTLPSDVLVTTNNIVDGTIAAADLATTGVTAGAYGSSSAIPIVTVNNKGQVTAASTTAIDSTTIANGTASVAVSSNGPITSNANHDFSSGIDITAGHLTLPDQSSGNGKIKLGAGVDLQLYHNGTDSFIENSTGSLYIRDTSGGDVRIQGKSGEDSIICHDDDGVHLYYDNAVKLTTENHGIDVTGNITLTGTVDGINIAVRDTLFGNLTTNNGVLKDGVTATTQSASDDTTKVATTAFVKDAITGYVFPSGTKMIFNQTSAPTGWTKVTSSVDNRALRVVSGTVGSGGSNTFTGTLASRAITANAGNTTQGGNISVSVGNTTAGGNVSVGNTAAGGNVSVSIANANTSGTVNSHTLSTSEMPSHTHSGGFSATSGTHSYANSFPRKGNNVDTGATGGGGGHSHGFSGGSHSHNANASFSGSNHNHNASFSGNAHNHNASGNFSGSAHNHSISVGNLDLAVQYIDVIIASKD